MKREAVGVAFFGIAVTVIFYAYAQNAQPQPANSDAADFAQAEQLFGANCSGCHGAGGAGGDRAPSLVANPDLRKLDAVGIGSIIKNGTPRGMPAFSTLQDSQVAQLARWLHSMNQSGLTTSPPEEVAAGEKFFFGEGGCAQCHMVHGQGGSNGPDLSAIALSSTPEEIGRLLDDPTSQMGTHRTASCPGWAFCPDLEWNVADVTLRDGTKLRGFLRNEAEHSLNIQTFDGKEHMLNDTEYVSYARETKSYMPPLHASADEKRDLLAYLGTLGGVPLGSIAHATAPDAKDIGAIIRPRNGDWPSYNGGPSGNRYSAVDQINASNVSQLKAAWLFTPGGTGLETTPVVLDGVMYVTGAQQVCALDARSGLSIWCTPRTSGQSVRAGGAPIVQRVQRRPSQQSPLPAAAARPAAGVASGNGPNRGVAILGDRVYFETDDAYLVSVNRLTGGVVWIVPLTDEKFPGLYYATTAPMIVSDLIVAGISGGDTPSRGFLVAFKAATGEFAWRFWTIPTEGEPLAATWKGTALRTGGAGTWMTGSYDPEAGILYWGIGNPYPSNDGDQRLGRNLYANSIVALDPKTGRLKWFYQATPHDLHDWDATAPLVLVDTQYQGENRKLLIQANRNGFFYVFDRLTGKLLLWKPFVKKMTWASGIAPDGMPILLPNYAPTDEGNVTCPAVRGATNWFGTSYNPGTKLFYVMAAEDCSFYRKTGRTYGPNPDFKDPGKRYLRALDIESGALVWQKPLTGSNEANYSGVLSTAGNLVFYGETAGGFAAVNAKTGATLWSFPTNAAWRATPMTYVVDGKQYVAVAAGSNIIAFALSGK